MGTERGGSEGVSDPDVWEVLSVIEIVIKGEPVAKGRPRFSRGHTYTPKKTRDQEELIRATYISSGGKMLEGAIEAEFVFIYEPPKSTSRRKRELLMGSAKMTRPDTDNLVKLCQDALNQVAYTDDSRIYRIVSEKVYGPEAMTLIRLRERIEQGM